MSNEKNRKNISALGEREENAIVNRMMAVFVAAVCAVIILLMIGNGGAVERTFVINVLPVMKIISLVLLAGTFVWYIIDRKAEHDSIRSFSPGVFVIASATLTAVMWLYTQLGVIFSVGIIIAVTVAAFVYYFYQRDFFWFTILTIIGAVSLVLSRQALNVWIVKTIALVAVRALCVIASLGFLAVIVLLAKKGRMKLFGRELIFREGTQRLPFIIAPALITAGTVIAFFAPAAATYAAFALLALYLVYAIIYTVKMM
ncbi:MAG: hypothetical protein WCQ72_05010 [Eubacteriales bacterium]